jgi:uncharacterized protein YndB with AHSA1/START domain
MKTILHVFDVNAPREKVFKAVTTQEGLANWWTTDVSVDPGVGGLIDFKFGGDFNPDMKVTRLEQDRAVQWLCVDGHANWQDNTFKFQMKDVAGKTRLTFTQDYATELSDEDYGIYNFNWGYYMESLRLYCEEGEGKPFKP